MDLSPAHWIYFVGTVGIILTMLIRKNVVVPAIVFTFLVAFSFTSSLFHAFQATFRASLVAASSLFDIFLIIAVMTALLRSLRDLGADEKMILPFQRVMVNGHVSFFVLIIVTYLLSLFFWPTPAVPLVGVLLIPVAIRSGLPALGVGMAISLAGQGMALSSDYIIQIAPTLSASSAGLEVGIVSHRAFILSFITGFIALGFAYAMIRKEIQKPDNRLLQAWEAKEGEEGERELPPINLGEKGEVSSSTSRLWKGRIFAFGVPVVFLLVVLYMLYTKFFSTATVEGGAGASLIGGMAFLLLVAGTITFRLQGSLERVSQHIIEGLVFAFRAMGVVLPIAGFFFLGNAETAQEILQLEEMPSFLFDLILAGESFLPAQGVLAAFSILLLGMVTGLDGSGFSGLPLTGALSGPLGEAMGIDPATLAAIGQQGAIWTGGGTLVAWSSLVAVAAFAKVSVLELVRKSFFPVLTGLIVSTLCAVFLFP